MKLQNMPQKVRREYRYYIKKFYSIYNPKKLADYLYYEIFHKHINWTQSLFMTR